MTSQIQVLIAFLLYLFTFGWIGWRRGAQREGWVFGVAIVAWFAFQERGDIVVRMANLGGKFMAFLKAGGLGEDGRMRLLAPWAMRRQSSRPIPDRAFFSWFGQSLCC